MEWTREKDDLLKICINQRTKVRIKDEYSENQGSTT